MFFILRQTALYRRYILSILFVIPLLLLNFLVTSHAPQLLEQAQTQRHQQLGNTEQVDQHSHSDGLSSEQIAGHTHGHNSGDHQHGSILLSDNQQLRLNASFVLNFNYFTLYYPPHLKLPEQPPKLLS
ncbi:MAG: hypothetical protein JKY55_07170 [Aliivibrio sp.]|uniref:hypothetical protein n=1 Tax=Aliivibrio sp. TaxID=1872443 RepID=UPI001A3A1335|nr:hypothetical protein [Aliivibrio sp.]